MRVLLLLLLLPFLAPQVLAQTAPLNDTGQTQCFDGGVLAVLAECTELNTGDGSTHPRQDGRFGRDAQAGAGGLTKTGSGEAGFDFTKIANNGSELEPSATLGSEPGDWACTRDNVTGRVWEVKVDNGDELRDRLHTYTWYDGSQGSQGIDTCKGTLFDYSNQCNIYNFQEAVNAVELCDYTDWRVPTRRELLSIVHYGATSNPRIDQTFFPNTVGSFYWSSDIYAPFPASAWVVIFFNGSTGAGSQTFDFLVRLVRSGQ